MIMFQFIGIDRQQVAQVVQVAFTNFQRSYFCAFSQNQHPPEVMCSHRKPFRLERAPIKSRLSLSGLGISPSIITSVPERRMQARECLLDSVARVEAGSFRALQSFVKILRNWRQQILNYFVGRHNNGFAEGLD